MKKSLIALAALAASGCASLENAGYDSYTVKSFTGPMGMIGCCELTVTSGKEYTERGVQFQTNGAGASLVIGEQGTKAFKGQGIAAKAAQPLPTMLGDVLK
jgi:hypothetical protein